jgi:signal transduction histidine kinase
MFERRTLTIREKLFLGFSGMAAVLFAMVVYVFVALNALKIATDTDADILIIQHQIVFVALAAIAAAVGIAISVTRIVAAQVQSMEEQKSEFVALASHQLRTPPTIVKYDSEILLSGESGKLTRGQRKYIEEIDHANQRMIDIIRSLLNVSRMEMGTFSVTPEKLDICAVVASVAKEFRVSMREKKITLKTACPKMPIIQADPRLVSIVLQSLLANAVKYTSNGGKIKIEVNASQNDIFVEVTDTGFGIPRSVQQHIFTKMFRADNARQHDPEGTGLGLYIAHAIIARVGGKMWFESEEGKGASFYFSLPRRGMKAKEGRTQLAID